MLRHQLTVLRRQVPRARLEPADRALLARGQRRSQRRARSRGDVRRRADRLAQLLRRIGLDRLQVVATH